MLFKTVCFLINLYNTDHNMHNAADIQVAVNNGTGICTDDHHEVTR